MRKCSGADAEESPTCSFLPLKHGPVLPLGRCGRSPPNSRKSGGRIARAGLTALGHCEACASSTVHCGFDRSEENHCSATSAFKVRCYPTRTLPGRVTPECSIDSWARAVDGSRVNDVWGCPSVVAASRDRRLQAAVLTSGIRRRVGARGEREVRSQRRAGYRRPRSSSVPRKSQEGLAFRHQAGPGSPIVLAWISRD